MEIKSVKAICEEEYVPLPFAYKILKKLEAVGLVKAYRGAAGGYQLIKAPSSITLLQIVTAVDDSLSINECLRDDYLCEYNKTGNLCRVHLELNRIQASLFEALDRKYISELV